MYYTVAKGSGARPEHIGARTISTKSSGILRLATEVEIAEGGLRGAESFTLHVYPVPLYPDPFVTE